MSLTKQLWLAIAAVTILVFGGALALSTLEAKAYLEEQIHVKNLDNATVLALALSQMPKDPVTLELQLTAQLDTGHYRRIRLATPQGQTLLEQSNDTPIEDVPDWFTRLVPLRAKAGVAQVQDGWKQFATLSVESHTRYAYAELWRGAQRLAGWFALAAAITGVAGSLLLRLILRPLGDVVSQAEAIGERRFITTPEPRTTEFRSVVRAMNALSERIRGMVAEESRRVEELRRRAQVDPLTDLLNRDSFLAGVAAQLAREHGAGAGTLGVLRVNVLTELNQTIGRNATDQFLRSLGLALKQIIGANPGWIGGRLNGADFALLAPGEVDANAVLEHLLAASHRATNRPDAGPGSVLPIGATPYLPGEPLAKLLARMDGALASAEANGRPALREAPTADDFTEPTDLSGWRDLLETALKPGGLKLGSFPVVTRDGRVLHTEAPARLNVEGQWLPAGRFVAWAARLGLLQTLDALVVDTALAHIAKTGEALGINLSPESIRDPAFASHLATRLRGQPGVAALLWIDVPEYGAFHHLEAFRAFCRVLKPLGCHIGLEHVGPNFSRVGDLHDMGLDYLKVDAAMIRDIDTHPGNQAFLRGLCMVAHAIGLMAIAEGVASEAEAHILPDLGVDGLTGPAIAIAS